MIVWYLCNPNLGYYRAEPPQPELPPIPVSPASVPPIPIGGDDNRELKSEELVICENCIRICVQEEPTPKTTPKPPFFLIP